MQLTRLRLLGPAVALFCFTALSASRALALDSASTRITVDVNAPQTPFPHFWEQMFGSGRAILSLRESYRKDLSTVHAATGFGYIRFHGIFNRGVGVFHLDAQGHPVYNWTYVDQIYDGLLARGVRPFVELSFMPPALAANPAASVFWYHAHTSPPNNDALWQDLIRHFARHLIARYGLAEVSQWYFEVWNEPNIDFWAGNPKQATYFHLYDVTATALKQVNPLLRVGGPATAQAAWVTPFLQHCVQNHIPVDFVSTHVYGNDSPRNVFGTSGPIDRKHTVARAVDKVAQEVAASPLPHTPIIFSEYNASYSNDGTTDSPFMGPWLANTIRQVDGKVRIMSYWSFSDVFEEGGVVKTPFYGGYGLIAADHIEKPAFNAFRLLHQLGDRRIAVNSKSALATVRPDGTIVVALWNYAPVHGSAPLRTIVLHFKGLRGTHAVTVQSVDPRHGNALRAWQQMGSPQFPSKAQVNTLQRVGALPAPEVLTMRGNSITVPLVSQELAIVTVRP